MKRYLLFLFLCLPLLGWALSQSSNHTYDRIIKVLSTKQIQAIEHFADFTVWIPTDTAHTGWAISLSEGNNQRIIGYAPEGRWTPQDFPPALQKWFSCLKEAPLSPPKGQTKYQPRATSIRTNISPLVEAAWHQNAPYNNLCPISQDGQSRCVAGCVAIAAAQVVWYWRKDNPAVLPFSTPTYECSKVSVTYSLPAGTPYEWDLIKPQYTTANDSASQEAVARLIYAIGTSNYLDYSLAATGGHNDLLGQTIYDLFNLNSEHLGRNQVTTETTWDSLLYAEVVAKRPVIISGSNQIGSHAFIMDGYDATNRLYHFNFGWGAKYNGYFSLGDTETAYGGYNQNVTCLIHIAPLRRNLPYTLEVIPTADRNWTLNFSLTNHSTLPVEGLQILLRTRPAQRLNMTATEKPLISSNLSLAYNDSIRESVCLPDWLSPTDTLQFIWVDGAGQLLGTEVFVLPHPASIEPTILQPSIHNESPLYYDLSGRRLSTPAAQGYYLERRGKRTTLRRDVQ